MTEWTLLPNYRPLGCTPGWMAAAVRQQGQCYHWSKGRPPQQCQRYLNGGEKMYLTPDGILMCGTHHDRDRLDRKKGLK